jgi:hypothetical protein
LHCNCRSADLFDDQPLLPVRRVPRLVRALVCGGGPVSQNLLALTHFALGGAGMSRRYCRDGRA